MCGMQAGSVAEAWGETVTAEDIVKALAAKPRPERYEHSGSAGCLLCGGQDPDGSCRDDCPHRMAVGWVEARKPPLLLVDGKPLTIQMLAALMPGFALGVVVRCGDGRHGLLTLRMSADQLFVDGPDEFKEPAWPVIGALVEALHEQATRARYKWALLSASGHATDLKQWASNAGRSESIQETQRRLVKADPDFSAKIAASNQKAYCTMVCRGAWALGTACGTCERCRDTMPAGWS